MKALIEDLPPDGQITSHRLSFLSSLIFLFFRNIPLSFTPNHLQIPAILSHSEGRLANVTNAGQGAVDAAASGVKRDGKAGPQGPVSDQTAR
jgi:hypothetical protein